MENSLVPMIKEYKQKERIKTKSGLASLIFSLMPFVCAIVAIFALGDVAGKIYAEIMNDMVLPQGEQSEAVFALTMMLFAPFYVMYAFMASVLTCIAVICLGFAVGGASFGVASIILALYSFKISRRMGRQDDKRALAGLIISFIDIKLMFMFILILVLNLQ
ncbi:MAG: hypothetical protein Q4B31_03290 [Clostridia bacterium]|nr:hypothetical protein [Clostridia bacterium]